MEILGRGTAWLDMGTPQTLHEASVYVKSVQSIQGNQIANLEEIALNKGWIKLSSIRKNISKIGNSSYTDYLQEIIKKN